MKKLRQRSLPQVRRDRQATGISPPAATASKGSRAFGSWVLRAFLSFCHLQSPDTPDKVAWRGSSPTTLEAWLHRAPDSRVGLSSACILSNPTGLKWNRCFLALGRLQLHGEKQGGESQEGGEKTSKDTKGVRKRHSTRLEPEARTTRPDRPREPELLFGKLKVCLDKWLLNEATPQNWRLTDTD